MRREVRRLLAGALAGAGLVLITSPARAECPYFVVPPATDAARSAREIVVGTVVENVGDQLYDFRLRIDRVLRGPATAGDVRRFDSLYPGWPLVEAGGTLIGPCEAIPGWRGNVIVLALDALAPDGKTRYNAASWISGVPLHRDDVPRTTLAEMEALAGMPRTDPAPSTTGGADRTVQAIPLVVLVSAGACGLVLAIRWTGRSRRREPQSAAPTAPGTGDARSRYSGP